MPLRPARTARALALAALVVAAPGAGVARADRNVDHAVVVSANPVDRTPVVLDGRVEALARVGDRIYVGGSFTSIRNGASGSSARTRPYLFAYDIRTNAIDPDFAPDLDGRVRTLAAAPDGSGIFVGGQFTHVNGVARAGLVKLAPATGTIVKQFKAAAGRGAVTDLAVAGGRLFVAGRFARLARTDRVRLGAVDVVTGRIDPELDLPLGGFNRAGEGLYHLDASPDGRYVIVVGNFSRVGTAERTQVAVIDRSTSPDSVSAWRTARYPFPGHIATDMRDVDIDQTGTYAVIATTCCPGADATTGEPTNLGDVVARWELAGTGEQRPTWWSYSQTDTSTAVAITGAAVYVGGHFRTMNQASPSNGTGGVERAGLVAFEPRTGVPFDWNPTRERGYGVLDILAVDGQLIVGHDTKMIGGEWHPRLAAFPTVGGEAPVATPTRQTLPAAIARLPQDPAGAVTQTIYDGAAFGAASAVPAWPADVDAERGGFVLGDVLYALRANGSFQSYRRSGDGWTFLRDLHARSDWTPAAWGWGTGPALDGRVRTLTYAYDGVYFTRTGDRRLWWAPLNLTNGLVGAPRALSGLAGDGRDWSGATALLALGDQLMSVGADGRLFTSDLDPATRADVAGTRRQLSGPGVDGLTWATGGALVALPVAG